MTFIQSCDSSSLSVDLLSGRRGVDGEDQRVVPGNGMDADPGKLDRRTPVRTVETQDAHLLAHPGLPRHSGDDTVRTCVPVVAGGGGEASVHKNAPATAATARGHDQKPGRLT